MFRETCSSTSGRGRVNSTESFAPVRLKEERLKKVARERHQNLREGTCELLVLRRITLKQEPTATLSRKLGENVLGFKF